MEIGEQLWNRVEFLALIAWHKKHSNQKEHPKGFKLNFKLMNFHKREQTCIVSPRLFRSSQEIRSNDESANTGLHIIIGITNINKPSFGS
jgi:hypothetical protein